MGKVLELRNISVSYGCNQVLSDVNLAVSHGRVLGLVGESGSGKSTAARTAAGLIRPDSGTILLNGKAVGSVRTKEEHRFLQMVFQNPDGSLNPKHTVGTILADAMLFHGCTDRANVRKECEKWIERMQLPEDSLKRRSSSFSGGQKQRIALARALCTGPKVLIADEPTSALDVSVQLQMLDLIRKLKEELGLTILFITHDLGVVSGICDDVAVMKEGKIVEQEKCSDFFRNPGSEYGRALLDAVPRISFDIGGGRCTDELRMKV